MPMEQQRIRTVDIAALEAKLDEVPAYEASTVTKRAAIARLMPQIVSLRSKGYTLQSIAELLTSHGLPVRRAVLQKYLKELGGGAKSKKRQQPPASAAGATPTPAAAAPAANASTTHRRTP